MSLTVVPGMSLKGCPSGQTVELDSVCCSFRERAALLLGIACQHVLLLGACSNPSVRAGFSVARGCH